ncbi:hypothetical protein U0E23_34725 [Burkholderia stagnalis]|uniref:hypothetical protein n=1 Tax=Burkholderia stagnalis TaxID=1503054 RepID=UPI002AB59548|nr:hypothetical protein [Burkholderia stagnalis]MDY7807584.1 hypothetical protein [Burkholderia stagnalis]
MKRAWKHTELAFVWLLIGIGFFTLSRVWTITARAIGSTKDFWDVATAIGTCAAVIAALFIADMGRRKQLKDERVKAALTAAGIQQRLANTRDSIEFVATGITNILAQIELDRGANNTVRKIIDGLRNEEDSIHKAIVEVIRIIDTTSLLSFDEIHTMAGLPDNCAMQIAAAQARVHNVRETLEAIEKFPSSIRRRQLENSRKPLAEASILMSNAVDICAKETKHIAQILAASETLGG